MNFLADESCAGPVIQALREAGHDVIAIAEFAKGTVDELVMRRAFGERRILVVRGGTDVAFLASQRVSDCRGAQTSRRQTSGRRRHACAPAPRQHSGCRFRGGIGLSVLSAFFS